MTNTVELGSTSTPVRGYDQLVPMKEIDVPLDTNIIETGSRRRMALAGAAVVA